MMNDYAEEFRGNWQKFDSFAWHDKPDDAEEWGIWHLDHRDSGVLAQSNAAYIRAALDEVDPDGLHWEDQHFNHWGVGWIDAVAIRVSRDGVLTPAFIALDGIRESLEDYCVLDEDDWTTREFAAQCDCIESVYLPGDYEWVDERPDDWVGSVFGWLWDNNQEALEYDGDCPWIDEKAILEACAALKLVTDNA